ncbi:MAG: tetratricopeptide repeat protein [Planctomycetota bacterium JB042]
MQPTPIGIALATLALLSSCSQDDPLAPPVPEAGVVRDDTLLAILDDATSRVLARPRDVSARMRLAAILDANGLEALAARAYEQVTRLEPEHPRAWYHLARMHVRLGETAAAEGAFRRAVELAPGYAPTHARLGRLFLSEGRADEAERAFAAALAVDPADPDARIGLARAALERGDAAAAAARLEPVVREHPGDGRARRLLARAWAESGETDRARALLEEAAPEASFRVDPWARKVAAMRVGVQGEFEEALGGRGARGEGAKAAALEVVAASRPADLGVLEQLVLSLERAGRADRALEVLEERRLLLPGHHRVELLLSSARWRRGDVDGAFENARRAVELQPGSAAARLHLADVLVARGDAAGAEAEREEARRLGAAVTLVRASNPAWRAPGPPLDREEE